jgi:hypothetical protein
MELKDAKQRYQTETPHAALHHVSSLVTGTKFVPSLRIELKKYFFFFGEIQEDLLCDITTPSISKYKTRTDAHIVPKA